MWEVLWTKYSTISVHITFSRIQSHGKTIARETGKCGTAACLGRKENEFHENLCLCHVFCVESSRESLHTLLNLLEDCCKIGYWKLGACIMYELASHRGENTNGKYEKVLNITSMRKL